MTAIILPKPLRKILVVGPVYDKMDKLLTIEPMIPKYDWIIFNGGICYPADELAKLKAHINNMNRLISTGKVIYLAGHLDYLLLTRLEDLEIMQWIRGRHNLAIADFPTHSVIITDGGLLPTLKSRNDLFDNLEVSFVSQVKDKPWHQFYNGGLGYVISNNPLTDQFPQYYKYSMQLGNHYAPDTSVYAQEVDEIGLKQIILL